MKYLCILISMAFLAACEQKETTVTNPPGEKKSDTTVIEKSSPATESKTESNTTINTGSTPGTSTSTTTTTSSSPSPQ